MKKVLLVSLFAAASVAAIAQQPVAPAIGVYIQPVSGGGQYCIDAHHDQDRDGNQVFIHKCHGVENERWTVTASPDNKHAIVGIGGYCLDVRGGATATGMASAAQLWQCDFQENQRFSLTPQGQIKEERTGKCLIATAPQDAAPLVLDTCKSTQREFFVMVK